MPRIRKAAFIGALLVPVVAGGFLLQARSQREGAELLDQVMTLVNDRYVDTLPTSDVYEKAAAGLVKELNDPYSELLTPKDLKQFSSRTGGRYGGLGMLIEPDADTKTVRVVTVYPNTPAEAGGVHEGDFIIRVDSVSTRGWTINQVSDSLTGTPGTKVKVSFARPGVAAAITGTFTRAIINVPAVPYIITLGNKIGYIPLQQFNENAADNIQAAVKKLEDQGARGIILDLRGDPGGILDQSLKVANTFLPQGQLLASVKGREGPIQIEMAKAAPLAPSIPLVVMTDDRTASASEIVAGALQDHDRALVVGQTSFGKGLVQGVYDHLDGGYALKLTTGKWFTPSGRSIQRPRKFVNGQFVEDTPDTNETNATKKNRPAYKSDAGRTVYGGGGITPDVIVADDTLTTPEQTFAKAIAPKGQDARTVLDDYAMQLSKTAGATFTVQPAWLNEFYTRLQAKGVTADRKTYDGANRYVSRLLEQRIAHFAAGDSLAKRRDLPYDAALRKALELIDKGGSQRELFALAGEPLSAKSSVPPAKKP
ncbi:MAG TPA: S41 family peptidase [Gemmatimonadaceae bacterium]|jgi:carboxyl-terminal processing protease|nr:S41 family peptidase [Gemmatimonadaceae bacterium]